MGEPEQEMVIGRPAAPLQPFVERDPGYRTGGSPAGSHRGLPSRHLSLIISLGQPVDVAVMPDRRQRRDSFEALVAGLHAAPAIIEHGGNPYGIHLDLTPLGARSILGLPAGSLAATVVHLDAQLGRRADELVDRLATTGDPRRAAPGYRLGLRRDRCPGRPVRPGDRRRCGRGAGSARRGLRVSRLQRSRPGGQPVELRHVPRRTAPVQAPAVSVVPNGDGWHTLYRNRRPGGPS